MTLIREKIRQAAGLLREFGVDCWVTFTRESEICGDPTLVFLAPGPVTWHSAFIVCADGRTRAVVGLYDQKGVEETGAYDKVVGYVTGIKEPLLEFLKDVNPRTIAVNYSKASEICD
ncbi:MAG: M24 family metallopeptidase, partial [Candidatus Aminicenantales bacterium]